jgi:mRNA-degrading endonuclease RelE of RelBE toxin-antitoxin system
MKREILWYQSAVEDIQQLSARNSRQATRIVLAVREYGHTGRGDMKKLSGSQEWRLRAGHWRIFMRLMGDGTAHITGFSDRQDAY